MKIGIVTLGCDKNLVDTEYLAGILDARGHEVVGQGAHAALDVLVIYTCGFIEAAREQSVGALEAYLEAKRRFGNPRRLVLVGCLTQRFGEELRPQLPEVDAIAGVGRPEALADLVEKVGRGKAASRAGAGRSRISLPPPSMRIDRPMARKRLDASPAAYLKIADGCDHQCSFCAIPAMKGPYTSVPREIALDEARGLLASGARELNLIAQDLSPYGRDLYDDYALPHLLEDLCRLEGDFRIRLLYLYPAGLTPRFLEVFAREPKICKYLDLPLQHLDPRILRAMRRPAGITTLGSPYSLKLPFPSKESPYSLRLPLPSRERGGGEGKSPRTSRNPHRDNAQGLIERLRRLVPEVVIRTTMIVGFPGETSEAFQNLLRGVREVRFERLGAFAFSPEEGTPAAALPGAVPPATARRRLGRLMREQAEVSAALQARQVGRTLRVLIESIAPDRREARGRSYREAPEVDGEVIVRLAPRKATRAGARGGRSLSVGDFVEVRITEADTHDLYGEAV